MTLVLIGKGRLLEGSTPTTKDKQFPGIDRINNYILTIHILYVLM